MRAVVEVEGCFEGVEKAIAGLCRDIARLEEEIRDKRAQIDRLVSLEEAAVSALGALASTVKALEEVDRESVEEIRETVAKILRTETKATEEMSSAREDITVMGRGRAEEGSAGEESSLEELSPCVSFDASCDSAFIKFRSQELAQQWAQWLRAKTNEADDLHISVEGREEGSVLIAKGIARTKALALSRAYLDIPPTKKGTNEPMREGVNDMSAGDVVRNAIGFEFIVTAADGAVVEIFDSEKRKMKYPASALSIVRRYEAS